MITPSTYRDATKSCCLLPKPLQEPLPQWNAYYCRNLDEQEKDRVIHMKYKVKKRKKRT